MVAEGLRSMFLMGTTDLVSLIPVLFGNRILHHGWLAILTECVQRSAGRSEVSSYHHTKERQSNA